MWDSIHLGPSYQFNQVIPISHTLGTAQLLWRAQWPGSQMEGTEAPPCSTCSVSEGKPSRGSARADSCPISSWIPLGISLLAAPPQPFALHGHLCRTKVGSELSSCCQGTAGTLWAQPHCLFNPPVSYCAITELLEQEGRGWDTQPTLSTATRCFGKSKVLQT